MNLSYTTLCFGLAALVMGCKSGSGGGSGNGDGSGSGKGGAAVGNLAGTYTITKGDNPGGKGHYEGNVNVSQVGKTLALDWILGGKSAYKGVALTKGNVVGVGWGIGGSYGVVVYDVRGGKLEGTWAAGGSGDTGIENLEGPDGLSGTFKVTKGQTPSGGSYTGTVIITPKGSGLFGVDWRLSNGTYQGAGIQEDGVLVVGYGVGGQGAGVVSYRVDGEAWTGRWATPGDTSFGLESLKKK